MYHLASMKGDTADTRRQRGPSPRVAKTTALLALSGALLCAAFYPPLYGLAVFFALVPALIAARYCPLGRLFIIGWIVGYFTNMFLFYWVAIVTVPGWLLLPVYLGLYLAVFLWGAELLARRFAVPRLLAVTALWPVLEYAKGSLLTGLPWFYLGHALYKWPRLIQAADIGGVIFLSTVIVLMNALIAVALSRGVGKGGRFVSVSVAVVVLAANVAYGTWRCATLPMRAGPTVGLVQPNVPQSLKISQTERQSAEIFLELRRATLGSDLVDADVVFWPETIMPGLVGIEDFWVANGMSPQDMIEEVRLQGAITEADGRRIAEAAVGGGDFVALLEEAAGAPLEDFLSTAKLLSATPRIVAKPVVAGVIAVEVDAEGAVTKSYNRACYFDAAGRPVGFYDKVHLVPFGEFVPFRESVPGLSRLLAGMMPIEPSTRPGGEFVVFDIAGVKYAPAICFEDTFSYIGRRCRRLGADVLLNLTNDGWFGDTFELDVHLGNAVFRAVETRLAVVRSANTGISAVISPLGEVTAVLSDRDGRVRDAKGTLASPISVSPAETVYAAAGDRWLAAASAVLAGFAVVGAFARRFE
ncbi:MAG: apolipoprotein N-acyltransferase [Planctomycetota bacterium]